MTSESRREFIKGIAAAGVGAASGCRSLFGGSFYGATIRDRLWMWGHHPDMSGKSVAKGRSWPGPAVDQAEGCRLMGIPNNCVIRWGNKPAYPWGDYFEQFKSLKRVTFGIADASKGSVKDKMRLAFDVLQPTMPNLTGCFLDDYFCPMSAGRNFRVLSSKAKKQRSARLKNTRSILKSLFPTLTGYSLPTNVKSLPSSSMKSRRCETMASLRVASR